MEICVHLFPEPLIVIAPEQLFKNDSENFRLLIETFKREVFSHKRANASITVAHILKCAQLFSCSFFKTQALKVAFKIREEKKKRPRLCRNLPPPKTVMNKPSDRLNMPAANQQASESLQPASSGPRWPAKLWSMESAGGSITAIRGYQSHR